ncbi:MAG: N-formylglutamate amidohydrolase [Henriciella sp.]|nr:N-formylglutamate amidohydrolase [Henriciella sp.]
MSIRMSAVSQNLMDVPASRVAPFSLIEPVAPAVPAIFASPHSGNYYPAAFQDQLNVPLMDLRRTEDAFVDELFAGVSRMGAVQICGTHGRAYVDLNRDARELDESMFLDGAPRTTGQQSARVKAGLGSLPRVGASGREIYRRKLSRAEGRSRLDHVHDGYHDRLHARLEQFKTRWSDVILIDCHSMPSRQAGRSSLPDIVLGDRFGSSCSPRLTSLVERRFRKLGLSVSRNAPYAGGYTTRRYGRPRHGVHALQIEINRGLYMREDIVEQRPEFLELQQIIEDVAEHVIGLAVSETL